METELGERLQGDRRYTIYRERNKEYWIYSEKGAQQVSRPGNTYTRCRMAARTSGCNLSTRRPIRRRSPPPPRPRSLALDGLPPSAGGGIVAV
jgi:hypothetical protein